MADFNIVLNSNERIGGRPVDQHVVREFLECLEDTDILDVSTRGLAYTWSNRRDGEERILSRIDRVLVSEAWKVEFKYFKSIF